MPADVLALFDLDGTLVAHDSEQSWVEFLTAEGRLNRVEVAARSRDITELYNRGEAGSIEFTEFYLGLMSRFPMEQLRAWRDRWIATCAVPKVRSDARALIEKHRARQDLIVMTTAVFRFLAEAQAQELGIRNVIATDESIVDGHFTGRISGIANAREGKVERLREWVAVRGSRLDDFRQVFVYADSVNDLPLLSHATRPVAVNPDPALAAHARHAGWETLFFS
jgi:HAD superfamily hydrolase (TIGR01490 family)